MSDLASSLASGLMRLHEWCKPPLEAGQYTLKATQEVKEIAADGEDAFRSEITFSVDAPRFALSPNDIYSVYPPKGQTGPFGGSLPHVVLTRRTLPWERTLAPGPRAEGDRAPWLALITLAASDFPDRTFPDVTTRKIADLITPGNGIAGPALGGGAPSDKHLADLCSTIDLPWGVFNAVAPEHTDLPFLAHVREVNTDAKETASYLGEGWFAVVVGNRVPVASPAGTENLALLVSLEGLVDCLPGGSRAPHAAVRLAVLSYWRFEAQPDDPFQGAIERLESGPLSLAQLPESGTATSAVNAAFAQGFVPLNHATRLGERTVSWYRGPLTPTRFEKEDSFEFRPTADAALRYDAQQGMFDVSYAAAFQLGRLLALQSRQFAQVVTAFRRRLRDQFNRDLERKWVQGVLDGASGDEIGAMLRAFLRTVGDTRSPPVDEGPGDSQDRVTQDPVSELTIPEPVGRWLARLVLLYRVPFTYLVPDQRMLERDRIRFFYLDPNWIKCLLEGACSVGRSSDRDEQAEQYLRAAFLDLALEQSIEVRSRPSRNAGNAPATQEPPARLRPRWPLGGFLLRSSIVEGWQGLEMHAYDRSNAPLDPLRIDRLAPDILLCLFNGEASRITLRQPAEGLHFGFKRDGYGKLCKLNLRFSSGDGAGAQVANSRVQALFRDTAGTVVKVAELANTMKVRLDVAPDTSQRFTSADFALQMISSAGRASFVRPPEGGRT